MRKRCGAVRQTKLKVLQRILQCRSPTKPLEKELAQTLTLGARFDIKCKNQY